MSQAKVDRYKKEKKNRGKQIKKKKFVKAFWVIFIALFIGACIGYPLGKGLYKINAKHRKERETVEAVYYDAWLNNYWNSHYYGTLGFTSDDTEEATDTDASYTDSSVEEDTDDLSTPADAE